MKLRYKEKRLMIKSKILKCGYTAREALVLLLHTDPGLDLQDIEEVYYPYVRFRYLISVGKGRRVEKLSKFLRLYNRQGLRLNIRVEGRA